LPVVEQVQHSMLDFLRDLPATPSPTSDYGVPYETLKAYLITTSNHDKSTPAFLSAVLMKYWRGARSASDNTRALALRQFDFYAASLRESNPYSSQSEA